MKTYYELLNLKPTASTLHIDAAFRQYVARVRPASAVDQVFADSAFRDRMNAYLVLGGDARERYDALLRAASSAPRAPVIDALSNMSEVERRTWMARVAFWRQEPGEALHILRDVVERFPRHAPAWALMGEVYFLVDRVTDGAHAYERAVRLDGDTPAYAARLHHAQEVIAGKAVLRVEMSPEQEMLLAERRVRWRTTMAIVLLGLVFVALGYFRLGVDEITWYQGALWVPLVRVALLATGVFFIIGGLTFGRFMPTFDRGLMSGQAWVASRGSVRALPYALLILATGVVSLWLCAAVVLVMAFNDEEWPTGPSILLGLCIVLDLLLVLAVWSQAPTHWTGAFFVGGNALVIAGLMGWWAGSIGAPME
jgi:hypothetical protein